AESMKFPIQKVLDSGNEKVFVTERGTSFVYQDLIVDFRGIPIMKNFGQPVIMDCTHALQMPNQPSGQTGGQPQYVETMAKCALVAGADGFFIETHPDPKNALSDGANMLPLHEMENLIKNLMAIKSVI
nr:3-deoxy-8-phosphooctulonate synthase [Chitinophagaceae bacterium]